MSFLSHGFGRLKDLADVPSTVGNEGKYLRLDGASNPIWDTPAGGGGGSQEVFVQDVTPVPGAPALWVQTGLGSDGQGFTLWAFTS